jgi:hypothetical protein
VEDGKVEASLSESETGPGGEWSGDLKEADDGSASVSMAPGGSAPDVSEVSRASFTSVVSEQGARSWMGMIKDLSHDGLIVTASQTSDPGPAALDGRMPFVRGNYLVKAQDGSLAASGSYEDVRVDESTMERTYSETYTTGSEPKRRALKVEYKVTGDPGLLPMVAGYEPPSGTAHGGR